MTLEKTGSSNPNDFEYTDDTTYQEIEFRPNGLKKLSVWPDGEPNSKSGYDCARMRMLIDNNATDFENQVFGPGPLPGNITIKDGQWKMARCGSTTVPHKYACKKRYDVDPVVCRDGYVQDDGNKCWKLGSSKINFDDAKTSCRIDHQGHLGEILSPMEQEFVNGQVKFFVMCLALQTLTKICLKTD